MSNPTYRSGPVTQRAAAPVGKNRLVALGADGIKHASADAAVFGAVTEKAAPATAREDNSMRLPVPEHVAVHIGGILPLEVAAGATGLTAGAAVYAAADGKVSGTGTVKVGVITDAPGENPATVLVHLRLTA